MQLKDIYLAQNIQKKGYVQNIHLNYYNNYNIIKWNKRKYNT